jgi:CubicO group peptidase (beta-lactamase class C family)
MARRCVSTLMVPEVLHVWDGYADAQKTVPWVRDTFVAAASSAQCLHPFCVHHLAAQGRLDYDRPVAGYGPESGAAATMVPGDSPYYPILQAYMPTETRGGALVYTPAF